MDIYQQGFNEGYLGRTYATALAFNAEPWWGDDELKDFALGYIDGQGELNLEKELEDVKD